MKKVDDFIKTVDEQVDHAMTPKVMRFIKKYFSIFSSLLLVTLLFIFIFRLMNDRPYHLASVIKSDLDQIEKNLNAIDKTCNILGMASDKIFIDFLNVEKFSGSTVGCINLAYPEKWQGPYLRRNPTFQGLFYEIIKTKEGLYVIPGFGAKLPNGHVVGKDFDITPSSSIAPMLEKGGLLNYKDEPLARKLKFVVGDWDPQVLNANIFDKTRAALKEFNEALPFVMNTNITTTARA